MWRENEKKERCRQGRGKKRSIQIMNEREREMLIENGKKLGRTKIEEIIKRKRERWREKEIRKKYVNTEWKPIRENEN